VDNSHGVNGGQKSVGGAIGYFGNFPHKAARQLLHFTGNVPVLVVFYSVLRPTQNKVGNVMKCL